MQYGYITSDFWSAKLSATAWNSEQIIAESLSSSKLSHYFAPSTQECQWLWCLSKLDKQYHWNVLKLSTIDFMEPEI